MQLIKTDEISEEDIEKKCISINSDFTGKSPNCISIEGSSIAISSWKELHIEVCNYLINKDSNNIFKDIKGYKGKKKTILYKKRERIKSSILLRKSKVVYGDKLKRK